MDPESSFIDKLGLVLVKVKPEGTPREYFCRRFDNVVERCEAETYQKLICCAGLCEGDHESGFQCVRADQKTKPLTAANRVQDRKTLVVRSKGKSTFFTPGGKREAGESDLEALTREIKEELNVDIVPTSVEPYGTFQAQAFGKPEGVMVRITGYTACYEGTLEASSEIEELRWIASSEKDVTTVTGQKIVDDLKDKGLID